jgi:hypothetical protein
MKNPIKHPVPAVSDTVKISTNAYAFYLNIPVKSFAELLKRVHEKLFTNPKHFG